MTLHSRMVPVDQVECDHGRWPVRVHMIETRLRRLETSMSEHGQREPIHARAPQTPGECYELVSGRRRLEAARRLGWDEILVQPMEGPDTDMAIAALSSHIGDPDPMTYLERGWATVKTRELLRVSGAEYSYRALARLCGVSKSTIENAVTLGTALPRRRVERMCRRLEVPVDQALILPQDVLLQISSQPSEERASLMELVMRARQEGTSPSVALGQALGTYSPPLVNSLERTGDGRLALRMDRPLGELPPEKVNALAQELEAAAATLRSQAHGCPTGVQSVQRLDILASLDRWTGPLWRAMRSIWGWLLRTGRGVRHARPALREGGDDDGPTGSPGP